MTEIQVEMTDREFQQVAMAAHQAGQSFNEFAVHASLVYACKTFQERAEALEERLAQYEGSTDSPPGAEAGSPAAEGLLPPDSTPEGPQSEDDDEAVRANFIDSFRAWLNRPHGL